MAVVVTALYPDAEHAEAVVGMLLDCGVRRDQIAVATKELGRPLKVGDPGLRRDLDRLGSGAVVLSVRAGGSWPFVRDILAVNGAEAIATNGFAPTLDQAETIADQACYSAHLPSVGAGSMTVRRGTPVVASDGIRVGAVDDFEEDMLLVDSGDLTALDWHIPFGLIGSISDEAVRLTVPAAEITSQPWHHIAAPVAEEVDY